MLQQTQADRVIPKYREFLQWFPDFRSLAQASTGDVIRAWSPLGYNMRAVRLHRLARQVMERFDGRLPQDVESLRGLDGVGEYTASAVACFAFGKEVAVIDTNVRRVVRRPFWETSEPSQ
ncbi:MAG: A/G-specific adenine glycosylase, partial [Chloroflexi bacterium]|nr:A/G-specific adenine glycosylase [Chloroflexota bacterium]